MRYLHVISSLNPESGGPAVTEALGLVSGNHIGQAPQLRTASA
jgi:hypothetical protein